MRVAAAARTLPALGVIPPPFYLVLVGTSQFDDGWPLTPGRLFKAGSVTVSALTHRAIDASHLLTCPLTLRPGRDALLTAVAGKLRGTISNEIVICTRRVVFAWGCFLATELTAAATLPAMFPAECLCRRHCLQNPSRPASGAGELP